MTMDPLDLQRRLDKIAEALELAYTYHSHTNEANAALHASTKVLYSPLTTKLDIALVELDVLKEAFNANA